MSLGSALPPVTCAIISARCRRGRRLSMSIVTCGRPIQGGVNSGRKVMMTTARSIGTRSMRRSRTSRVVGSLQCTSSHTEVQGRIAVAGRDREQVRQQGDGLTEIIGPLRQHSLKLGQALLLRILTSKAGCALKLSDARIQGAVLVMGRAEIPQSGMWLAA